jgi:hypothetical protein
MEGVFLSRIFVPCIMTMDIDSNAVDEGLLVYRISIDAD